MRDLAPLITRTLLAWLLTAATCSNAALGEPEYRILVSTTPSPLKSFYSPGDALTLGCVSDPPMAVIWLKYNRLTNTNSVVSYIDNAPSVNYTFTAGALQATDSGAYFCQYLYGHKQSDYINISVATPNALFAVSPRVISAGVLDTVTLQCNQTFPTLVPLQWFFDNATNFLSLAQLNTLSKSSNYTMGDAQSGYALTLTNAAGARGPSKFGTYVCMFNSSEPLLAQQTAEIDYHATPDISFENPKSGATIGDSYTMTCLIYGADPSQPVIWRYWKNGQWQRVGSVDRPASLLVNGQLMPNCTANFNRVNRRVTQITCVENSQYSFARQVQQDEDACQDVMTGCRLSSVLLFGQVSGLDSGNYSCEAQNEFGVNRAVMELKVRDPLAALWPFLGMMGEVLILCAIIFVYERHRSRRLDREAAAARAEEEKTAYIVQQRVAIQRIAGPDLSTITEKRTLETTAKRVNF